jgi:hypothetical protein
MEIINKIVDFSKCKECIHYDDSEDSDPCDDCFNNPTQPYSHTPVHFEKDENIKTRNNRRVIQNDRNKTN